MSQSDKATIIEKRKAGYSIYEIREIMEKKYSIFQIAFICEHAKIMTNQRRRAR